jgi:hypothetical protein
MLTEIIVLITVDGQPLKNKQIIEEKEGLKNNGDDFNTLEKINAS